MKVNDGERGNEVDDKQSEDNQRGDSLAIDRRGYLKHTGALAGALTVNSGVASADEEDGGASTETNETGNDAAGGSNPTDLRVEYAQNPLGVDTRTPRFSWNVDSMERSHEQTAYQILVASNRPDLRENAADVWDSGTVSSTRSSNIEYAGPPLESGERYHWKVRVWDADGDRSDWSEPAHYETGLLDESEWDANWIGTAQTSGDGQLPGEQWTDYTLETDFTIEDRAVGFVFRATDQNNLYMWQVNLEDGPSPPNLRPHVRENGNWTVLDAVSVGDVLDEAGHEQHRISIDVSGNSIETHLDGQQVDSRTDSTHSNGTIGLRTGPWSNQRARFDNLRVVSPEDDLLFADDFSHGSVDHFSAGSIEDGQLDLEGSGVVLREASDRSNPLLRRELALDKQITDARAYVCGLGYYELYLNNEKVGDRVLDPARTDYAETDLYATYDVTDQLRNGENAIGVALGRGRYGEPEPRIWDPPAGRGAVERPGRGEMDWWSDPELLFQLEIEFADGTTRTVVSDDDWKTADGPTRFNSLLTFKETYDAREEKSGWTEPGYDDSGWENASDVDGPGGELVSQQVQPIAITDTVEPKSITEAEPGTYVFDLGQMIAGWVELTVEGERGTEVTVSEGEQLADDGTIQEIHYGGSRFHQQQYTLEGDGRETWEPRFSYGGFRYVQVEGYPGTPTKESITGKVIHSRVDEGVESQFSSSNELLNQIHENSRRAMENNLYGIHHGTPTWEKLGWMETKIELGESLIYNFSMPRFWTKFLRDCRDSQKESGDIRYVVPSPEPYSMRIGHNNDPGWDAAYPVVAWLMYTYYGDERVLEEQYEGMKKYVQYVRENADGGEIVRTGLGDYKAPDVRFPPEGPEIVSTAHYFQSAQIVARAANVLDKDDDAAEFGRLGEDIGDAFHDEFFDAEASVYRTGEADEYRQTSNVYPLEFGLVPDEHEAAVVQNLVDNIVEVHDSHLDVGAHGLQYLLPVLTEHGHGDVAYTIATQTTYPSWGYWIENDITALLEAWDLDARTRTHDWLGSIDQWFYQYLAGIREPIEPGFERVEIAPEVVGDLEHAAGTVETVRGTVTSQWERTDSSGEGSESDGIELSVTIPGNTTGTVRIPTLGGDKVRVRESGKNVWTNGNRTRADHPGVREISRKDGSIVVEVGSGEYAFELEQLG